MRRANTSNASCWVLFHCATLPTSWPPSPLERIRLSRRGCVASAALPRITVARSGHTCLELSLCRGSVLVSNLKLYTDRMQERSVPPSKQVENRLARVWHSHALEPKITGGIMAPSRVADAGNRARKKNTDRPTQSASTPLHPSSREHLCLGVQYRRASASRGACRCGQFAHVPLLAAFGSTKVHAGPALLIRDSLFTASGAFHAISPTA